MGTAADADPVAPAVSVVVPTFRRPELLPRLVHALEAQTLGADRFEVVVVDNGSGDATAETLQRLAASSPLQLRVLTITDNRGPAPARNLGWREARAAVVAYTDDDCVPEPGWLAAGLEALGADATVGVVQGCTRRPEGAYPYTALTVYREVLAPSPWFEGCNLFFRRDALAAAGGFDEAIHFGGEDTAAGWGVLAAGWGRAFAADAVVHHDIVERPLGFHLRMAWREGELVALARRFPTLRTEGFWRPWALRPLNVWFVVALLGLVLARRRPAALVLCWPYVHRQVPDPRIPGALALAGRRIACDAVTFVTMKVASVRHRALVL